MTLLRLVWPDAMVTELRDTFKSFAKNSMQASLALPSTGGEVKETFRASPSSPVMSFFFALGWTFIAKATPSFVCRMGIKRRSFSDRPSTWMQQRGLEQVQQRLRCI